MRSRSRRCAYAALVALGALLSGACGSTDADPGQTLTLRVGDQKGGARSVLAAAGLLDGLPYRIAWSEFPAGPPLLEALNAGAIDLGVTGDAPPLFAQAAGVPLRLVAVYRGSVAGSGILLPPDSPIRSVAELRGRKVAVQRGSSAHHLLLAALRKAGLDFSDLQVVYLSPPDAFVAFGARTVDAWTTWDPFTATAELLDGARMLQNGEGLTEGLSFQNVHRDVLADPVRAAAVGDYLVRLARAREWATGHKDAWAAAWAVETHMSLDVAQRSVGRSDARAVPIDERVVEAQQRAADAFLEQGLLPQPIRVAEVFDRRFDDEIRALGRRSAAAPVQVGDAGESHR